MTWAARYPASRLVPSDPSWPAAFTEIAVALMSALGLAWVVEHVGSTSVPGLAAKPVIDVALRCPEGMEPQDAAPELLAAAWTIPEALGDHWATFRVVGGVRSAIGHVFTAEQWPEAHVRLFAAWLRDHPSDRDRYADLKVGLVRSGTWGSEYTAAKSAFVLDVVNRARTARGLARVTAFSSPTA